jgi:phage/plasmid-associated DNA primase
VGLSELLKHSVVWLQDVFMELGTLTKSNLGLLQRWITGQMVPVNRKFKTMLEAKLPPFCMAGNNCMEYSNDSGSMKRRLAIFDFAYKVERPDFKTSRRSCSETCRGSCGRPTWPTY